MSDTKGDAEALCFIDTNIWLYAFIESQDPEKTIVAKSVIQNHEVVVSPQVVNEVCVNLIKKVRFDEPSIQDLIASFYTKYRVVDISREVLLKASQLRQRYQVSFWDSLIVSSALSAGATVVYSEDMQAGLVVDQRLRIVNPFTEESQAT